MKKLFFVLTLAVLLAVFGCTKDDSNPSGPGTGGPAAPTNFSIQATNDGLGIIITWSAVANVDSYMVQTPDNDVVVAGNQTTYTDNAPQSMGTYRVRAYSNDVAGTWTSTLTTTPMTGSGQIGEWSYSSIESCYYWDSDGYGHAISRLNSSAPALADIFLYFTSNQLYIVSAHSTPLNGNNQTNIAWDNSTTPYAPSTGYATGQPCSINGVFWLELSNGHYVRLDITILNANDITFSWLYQLVQGFRYVE